MRYPVGLSVLSTMLVGQPPCFLTYEEASASLTKIVVEHEKHGDGKQMYAIGTLSQARRARHAYAHPFAKCGSLPERRMSKRHQTRPSNRRAGFRFRVGQTRGQSVSKTAVNRFDV